MVKHFGWCLYEDFIFEPTFCLIHDSFFMPDIYCYLYYFVNSKQVFQVPYYDLWATENFIVCATGISS